MSALIIERVYLNRIDFKNLAWCGFESQQKLEWPISFAVYFYFFLILPKSLIFSKSSRKMSIKNQIIWTQFYWKIYFVLFGKSWRFFYDRNFCWFSGTTKNSSGFCYSHFNYFIFDDYSNTFIVNLSPSPCKTCFENIFKN